MKRKERQDPWNPFIKKCYGCHDRIINDEISHLKFCNKTSCEFVCDEDDYDLWIEEYYSWKVENDTNYERSDEDLCGKLDRVWDKIMRIQESEISYSGEYMFNYVCVDLYEKKIIDRDQVEEIRNAIRVDYCYNINKNDFDALCKLNIDDDRSCFYSPNGWRLDDFLEKEME